MISWLLKGKVNGVLKGVFKGIAQDLALLLGIAASLWVGWQAIQWILGLVIGLFWTVITIGIVGVVFFLLVYMVLQLIVPDPKDD